MSKLQYRHKDRFGRTTELEEIRTDCTFAEIDPSAGYLDIYFAFREEAKTRKTGWHLFATNYASQRGLDHDWVAQIGNHAIDHMVIKKEVDEPANLHKVSANSWLA